MKTKTILCLISGLLLTITACKDYLKENPPGELAPDNLLTTKEGVEAILNNAYLEYKWNYGFHEALMSTAEYPCDVLFQSGGGMNIKFILMSQFQWTPSTSTSNDAIWGSKYKSIRDANIVIDNIDNFTADAAVKKQLLAEARYIRAVDYYYLYDAFGPVPLRISSIDPPDLPRASEEEILTFIETELQEAAIDLPFPGTEEYNGRATKGAALGYLARHYLNTKQWQKAVDATQDVFDLGYYELFPSYRDLFKVENEPDKNPGNREMIAVSVNTNVDPYGTKISAAAMPPAFAYTPQIPEFMAVGIANWAAQFRIYSSFITGMDTTNDKRFDLIFTRYVNTSGATVNLMSTPNNLRTLKFFDNGAEVASHGNDHPMLRYADILLMRAEALNELNGPTQAAIDLIDEVRNRAGLGDLVLADFPDKAALRDHILIERKWEFYYEGLRRSDLIRHGKFISGARARGVAVAADYHVRYPIPQNEMDANPNMMQNEGYE
ncbi:MAG TPA: RagB/SusD family nutrient uptake outer membrane protein [Bacteroidales bacterium]|nr:RagB/SusD family nutrient uptake outer membrane protein [Bacteroidales bacterium]